MKLSIIIPCYNEEKTIEALLLRVCQVPVEKEIIVVNDGSSDRSPEIPRELTERHNIKLINHPRNYGKGRAFKSALKVATGEVVIVQDADLEYDPQDFIPILDKFKLDGANVVYGSRNLNKENRHSYFRYYLGGVLITKIANLLFSCRLTDEPTCYKAFRMEVITQIDIEGEGFEWEPEVTAKLLRAGYQIVEVPIKYFPRSFKEGKKLSWRDGVRAIFTLIKYRFPAGKALPEAGKK
ncbi:MAG: glycosyltransferase family 2 protein [Candidatus Zixiibacteriota bacterium]